jgi:hypothetical protein
MSTDNDPLKGFTGATTKDSLGTATGIGGPRGFGSTSPAGEPERPAHVLEHPAGAGDPEIPLTSGNQHMVIGASAKAIEEAEAAGHDVIRTREPVGELDPSPVPEFAPGLPKPRTDVDADPHEKTDPGFQGLDKPDPPVLTAPPVQTEVHRGAPNEVAMNNSGPVDESQADASARRLGLVRDTAAGASPNFEDRSLPEHFPHRKELEAAGLKSVSQVRLRAEAHTLMEIPGITRAKAEDIIEALLKG